MAEEKAAEEERHKIAVELADRKNKVKNLKIKYESLVQVNYFHSFNFILYFRKIRLVMVRLKLLMSIHKLITLLKQPKKEKNYRERKMI